MLFLGLQSSKVSGFAKWHELRTPNEGMNQRYLKNGADVADKICFGRTKNFGIGIEFWPCIEGYFLSGRP